MKHRTHSLMSVIDLSNDHRAFSNTPLPQHEEPDTGLKKFTQKALWALLFIGAVNLSIWVFKHISFWVLVDSTIILSSVVGVIVLAFNSAECDTSLTDEVNQQLSEAQRKDQKHIN